VKLKTNRQLHTYLHAMQQIIQYSRILKLIYQPLEFSNISWFVIIRKSARSITGTVQNHISSTSRKCCK